MAKGDDLLVDAVEKFFVSRKNWCGGAAARWTQLWRGVVGGLGLRRGRLAAMLSPAATARGVCEGCEKARCEEEEVVPAAPLFIVGAG